MFIKELPTALDPEHRPAQVVDVSIQPQRRGAPSFGTLFVALGVAIGFAMSVMRPALAAWVNDEATFIGDALLANHNHAFAVAGLVGSLRIHYSPLPIWFYQALLLLAHNARTLLALHSAIFFTATIASYYWLGTELSLRLRFLPILALSPGLFFFARAIWDNPLNVPISAIILASFASMLRRPSKTMAAVMTAACITAVMIHPMSMALVCAVAIAAIERHRRLFWRHRYVILATAICCLLPFWQYFLLESRVQAVWLLRPPPGFNNSISSLLPYPVPERSLLDKLAFSWTGVRQIIADSTLFPRYSAGLVGAVHRLAVDGSRLAYGAFAIGVLLMPASSPVFKRLLPRLVPLSPIQMEVAKVGLIAVLLQTTVFAATRFPVAPFYLNGFLAVFVLFTWLGIDALPTALGNCLVGLLVLCMFTSTFLSFCCLLQRQGQQIGYGPTIGEQERILRELHQRHAVTFLTNVPNFQYFPHALRTLALLNGLHFDRNNAAKERPFVCYNDLSSGRLSVTDVPPQGKTPLVEIDLTVPVQWRY